MKKRYTFISLFCGTGGSSLGYKLAGFKELLAIDNDKNAVESFKNNFKDIPIWNESIGKVTGEKILKYCKIKKKQLDLLDGSPPCQGFSLSGKRKIKDDRNYLYKHYIRILKSLQPKIFIMENVSGLCKGVMKHIYLKIYKELQSSGYNVKSKLMNSKYYGVPQSRERLIFIGIRNDLKLIPSYPKPSNKIITVYDALKDIYNKESESNSNNFILNLMKRVKPGDSASKVMYGNFFDCIRLSRNAPSPTVKKSFRKGMNAFYHPKQNRNLTIQELKRICTFPDDWILTGNFEEQWARLGNAVMPQFMKKIALHIKNTILNKVK